MEEGEEEGMTREAGRLERTELFSLFAFIETAEEENEEEVGLLEERGRKGRRGTNL